MTTLHGSVTASVAADALFALITDINRLPRVLHPRAAAHADDETRELWERITAERRGPRCLGGGEAPGNPQGPHPRRGG